MIARLQMNTLDCGTDMSTGRTFGNGASADSAIVKELEGASDAGSARGLRMTPLHFAAKMGARDQADALIAAGADLNATDRLGWTPLHFAAFHGQTSVAEVLLAAGANPNIPDFEGSIAGDWARSRELQVLFENAEGSVPRPKPVALINSARRILTNTF